MFSLPPPLSLCVQGSGADDEDGLSRDSGGRQAGSHLPRTGHAPQPAEPHDATRWAQIDADALTHFVRFQ